MSRGVGFASLQGRPLSQGKSMASQPSIKTARTRRAVLPAELNVSFVERYMDGVELSKGAVQGIRFDIVDGEPSFRVGVRPGERGDITIEITVAAAQTLNSLRSGDPAYSPSIDHFRRMGQMGVDGDPSWMGSWLAVSSAWFGRLCLLGAGFGDKWRCFARRRRRP